ncbi:UDP-glucose dehydrogenase family protein [Herbiconiux sp. SYSU D00978]|uniref:UDP-glucose dehydrogenase family protein n=1 Tax=Herbiconiux sp. SYSU D00978 TaxID=2812562 RepID=UPI001A97359F|nr:UDP-glucose/GDP-mannose dehydrogenase family protein [Herbiconiux sp. SYSU D00978]
MKISVIGCGYLGAVHAAAMADLGHDVIGIDVDAARVEVLAAGHPPFYEPGLPALLARAGASGRLRFSTDIADAAGASVHFVAVGTPQRSDGNGADLTFLNAAVDALLPHLAPGDLVVGKSTVPVGTAADLLPRIATTGASLAWNPEFLREGHAIADTLIPDRIVYGLVRPADETLLDEVYAGALAADVPKIVTDLATAELVKVAANAFLATKISFINAMAEVAEATGADVTQLADALGHDERIGRRFLGAGLGFGGGCLPKDIRAFMARADELGVDQALGFLGEVDAINNRRRDRLVDVVLEEFGGSVAGRRIAVLGLAFKPDSDDVRDSPALDVAVRLAGLGAEVTATDPQAVQTSLRRHPQLRYATCVGAAVTDAEAVLVLTEWREYRELDPAAVGMLASSKLVVDGRNCLDRDEWVAAGWRYRALGRPAAGPARVAAPALVEA